jgi:competence protein ComEC
MVLPLMAGIIVQWYLQVALQRIIITACCFSFAFVLFSFLPIAVRFKWRVLQGFILTMLMATFGLLITRQKDIRHDHYWYGNYYQPHDYLIVTINEPLIEKANSFKAEGYVESVINGDTINACKGKILLYFSKDSNSSLLHYGKRILINKDLQAIKNSGNPGAFNYEQYAAFQQIFHQVYLKENDWIVLHEDRINTLNRFIFRSKSAILSSLQKNLDTNKDALGIAEALLIGYTNDLDKDLVQAYSNTGVVHIIAISGMHLALIYLMLVWIFARIPFIKNSRHLQLLMILSCLWLFSLLTGASASVLRAAVMFTFIALGKNYFRETSVYNSLAASAFILLCYNPYFLWDVGFQLSYLAVIGIVAFQRPLSNLFYIKNKWIDKVWQLMSVSLAAQVLTFPVCIYYFHQFPVLFLLANIIAVPLSGIILYAEIGLVAFSWVPYLGAWLGKITGWLVWLMNTIILRINEISFSVWDKIPATVMSTIMLYAVVISLCNWLISKNKRTFCFSLICLLAFTLLQALGKWQAILQKKLIVYNVPKHQAIDFTIGNTYHFIGDSILKQDGLLPNFHLKPGRVLFQMNKRSDSVSEFNRSPFYQFQGKRILLYDGTVQFETGQQKIQVDIIIISHNPRLYILQLARVFNCGQFVFDGSNSLWKIGKWQADCRALHLQSYSVPEKGAYVLDLAE